MRRLRVAWRRLREPVLTVRPDWSLPVIAVVVGVLALALAACGPKRVRLTIGELRDLEACVIAADDQVERQNCVERFLPPDER